MDGIKVEVKNPECFRKAGNSQKTGKPYEFVEQEGWVHLPNEPYPVKCRFTLPDERQGSPYPPGTYSIDLGKCLTVGRFDALHLSNRLYLVAFQPARSAAPRSVAAGA